MRDVNSSKIQKKIFQKMKELECCGELRIKVDNKLISVNGCVIENCGQYLIILKDELSNEKLKETLLHEGLHIYLNHLESADKSKSESEVNAVLKEIY